MSTRLMFIFLSLCLSVQASLQSQLPPMEGVFNDAVVARIDIFIHPDSLATMLLPQNLQSDHEYPADFVWNNGARSDSVKNIGFRLRGNTSRSSKKKSFKVKFNHFGSPKFQGLSDLNLNGEHNDPTLMRAKLSWDIMRHAGIEAPRSSYVALYINQEYRGLYLNVEHIDNDYFEARKKDPEGQLFKCFYGCDFRYEGDDPKLYNPAVYSPENQKEMPDYQSFINFVKALNKPTDGFYRCNLESVFDVDSYLKRMAIEILVGHWDNPLFNKNNAYVYVNPSTKKLELLSYDIDNTFGVDWFNVNWADRNIYSWSPSSQPRPIYTQLLKISEYQIRFGYYIRAYCKEFFNPGFLNPHIDRLKQMISPYRVNDVYASYDYNYNYNDFLRSFDEATGAHVKFGLKEYIARRSATALSQVQNTQIAPIIENVHTTVNNTSLIIRCKVTSLTPVSGRIQFKKAGMVWVTIDATDDGVYPDNAADDGVFACILPVEEKKEIEYVITAVDGANRTSRIPICGSLSITAGYDIVPELRINEFMADNSIIQDEKGETDDWIEIFNAGNSDIDLGDKYLTDNPLNMEKWRLPPIKLGPGEFLVIWADEDQEQGQNHANFKLSKSGEFIGIFDRAENLFAPIDTFSFGLMPKNVSFGRLPDGQGGILSLSNLSPGRSNMLSNLSDPIIPGLSAFPNPFREICTITGLRAGDDIQIFNEGGLAKIKHSIMEDGTMAVHTHDWKPGAYWLIVQRGPLHRARLLVKI